MKKYPWGDHKAARHRQDNIAKTNIGITHVISCINICRIPRKLFEHKAVRLSVLASSEGPDKC